MTDVHSFNEFDDVVERARRVAEGSDSAFSSTPSEGSSPLIDESPPTSAEPTEEQSRTVESSKPEEPDTQSTKRARFPCGECSMEYSRKFDAQRHWEQVHQNASGRLYCQEETCEGHQGFTRYSSLYRHMRKEHSNTSDHKLDVSALEKEATSEYSNAKSQKALKRRHNACGSMSLKKHSGTSHSSGSEGNRGVRKPSSAIIRRRLNAHFNVANNAHADQSRINQRNSTSYQSSFVSRERYTYGTAKAFSRQILRWLADPAGADPWMAGRLGVMIDSSSPKLIYAGRSLVLKSALNSVSSDICAWMPTASTSSLTGVEAKDRETPLKLMVIDPIMALFPEDSSSYRGSPTQVAKEQPTPVLDLTKRLTRLEIDY